MTPHPHRAFRLFVLRWHRRVGLVLCFAIIWIATTGIFLNHMYEWRLAEKLIQNPWLRQQYAVTTPIYYPLDDTHWVAQTAGGELLLNGHSVATCDSPLQGAVATEQFIALACTEALMLLTPSGVLIETVGESQGLPTPITGMGLAQGRLMLRAQRWSVFNDVDLSFTFQQTEVQAVPTKPFPSVVYDAIETRLAAQPVSWERVLIDMHTGTFWGSDKRLISDIAAVLMMLIAVGGVWVWLSKPGRFRSHKEPR